MGCSFCRGHQSEVYSTHFSGSEMGIKELKEAWQFMSTVQFWRISVLWTLCIVFSYLQLFFLAFFSRRCKRHPRIPPKQYISTTSAVKKPICIVTGATSGLGAEAVYALSKEGYCVVLAGRSSDLLFKVVREVKKRNSDAILKAFQVDISSFESILKFKSSLQRWLLDSDMHSSIQLLINNAGILATSSRLTPEGYDLMMATNYIGAFCLTKVLLPLLENSPVPSRIVNVTSFTHRSVWEVQVDRGAVTGKSFLESDSYPYAHMYEYTKLWLLLFSYEFHRQVCLTEKSRHVSVIAADPGVVRTNIMREVPSCISMMAFLVLELLGLLQSPKDGVCSIIDAALAPPELSGIYFFGGNGRTLNSSALSYNHKLSKDVWDTSCDLLQELQLACKDTST